MFLLRNDTFGFNSNRYAANRSRRILANLLDIRLFRRVDEFAPPEKVYAPTDLG